MINGYSCHGEPCTNFGLPETFLLWVKIRYKSDGQKHWYDVFTVMRCKTAKMIIALLAAVFVDMWRRRRGDAVRGVRRAAGRCWDDRQRRGVLWRGRNAGLGETVLARTLSRTHPYASHHCRCYHGGCGGGQHCPLADWNMGTGKQPVNQAIKKPDSAHTNVELGWGKFKARLNTAKNQGNWS